MIFAPLFQWRALPLSLLHIVHPLHSKQIFWFDVLTAYRMIYNTWLFGSYGFMISTA